MHYVPFISHHVFVYYKNKFIVRDIPLNLTSKMNINVIDIIDPSSIQALSLIWILDIQVSAIISPDKAVVLKSRREKENENIIAPMLKAIDAHDQLPFELCAMEALLHATVM